MSSTYKHANANRIIEVLNFSRLSVSGPANLDTLPASALLPYVRAGIVRCTIIVWGQYEEFSSSFAVRGRYN